MNRVLKYPLRLVEGPQPIDMPKGAEIVHVFEQDERPTLWALVDDAAESEIRTFAVFATGQNVGTGGDYVGTIHLSWTVWHIFEAAR